MLSGSGFAVPASDSATLEGDADGSLDASETLMTTSPSLLVLLSAIPMSPSTDAFAMRFDINGSVKSPEARPNPKNKRMNINVPMVR